jgi:hypothetical protein
MKLRSAILSTMILGLPAGSVAADEGGNLFKDAWKKCQDPDYGEVTGKLRDLIKLLEDKTARRAEMAIPERVADWSGGDLKRESCAFMEGGVSVQRAYRKGAKEISVKLLKDSPVGDEIFRPPLKVS